MNPTLYRLLYAAIMGSAVGGFLTFQAGHVPVAVALWAVALACMIGVVVPVARKGLQQVDGKPPAQGAGEVVATRAAPAPLTTVLAALDGLNDPDVPFVVTAEPTPDGARVTVRWRIEELRWKTLFTQGSQVYNWKMEVKLDAAHARYGFLEYQSQTRHQEGVWPPRFDWAVQGSVGKTSGQRKVHIVMTPAGSVRSETRGMDGPRTSWVGAVSIRPADAKIPVLTTLRNHGWRPRVDGWGARLFER